jgi:hypothetical protein
MTSQLQTDKNPFQFHIISIGMNRSGKMSQLGRRKTSSPSDTCTLTWITAARRHSKPARLYLVQTPTQLFQEI